MKQRVEFTKKQKIIIIVLVVIFVLLGILCGLLVFKNKNNNSPQIVESKIKGTDVTDDKKDIASSLMNRYSNSDKGELLLDVGDLSWILNHEDIKYESMTCKEYLTDLKVDFEEKDDSIIYEPKAFWDYCNYDENEIPNDVTLNYLSYDYLNNLYKKYYGKDIDGILFDVDNLKYIGYPSKLQYMIYDEAGKKFVFVNCLCDSSPDNVYRFYRIEKILEDGDTLNVGVSIVEFICEYEEDEKKCYPSFIEINDDTNIDDLPLFSLEKDNNQEYFDDFYEKYNEDIVRLYFVFEKNGEDYYLKEVTY